VARPSNGAANRTTGCPAPSRSVRRGGCRQHQMSEFSPELKSANSRVKSGKSVARFYATASGFSCGAGAHPSGLSA
jgi:hypothetical protein